MLLPFDPGSFSEQTVLLDRWARQLDRRVLARRWAGRLHRALEAEAIAASTRMEGVPVTVDDTLRDRKSTRLNSSHSSISYADFCLKKKNILLDGKLHHCNIGR